MLKKAKSSGAVLIGGSPDVRQQICWKTVDKHIASLVAAALAPAPATV